MQLDLFPKDLKKIYRKGNCFDLSEPPFKITCESTGHLRYFRDRINFLSSLPKERYFIFKGEPPYVYDKQKGKRIYISDTRRAYSTLQLHGKPVYMHTLVGIYLIENKLPNVTHQLDHIDGDHTNYRPDNLEWVSPSENQRRKNK